MTKLKTKRALKIMQRAKKNNSFEGFYTFYKHFYKILTKQGIIRQQGKFF